MSGRLLLFVGLLASLLWGCGTKPAADSSLPGVPGGGPTSTSPSGAENLGTTIAPISEEQARAFGKAYRDSMLPGQTLPNGAENFIDWKALVDRAMLNLDMSETNKAAFTRGVVSAVQGPNGLLAQLQSTIHSGGTFKMTRVLQEPAGTRVRFRMEHSEGGVNFHDYLLQDQGGRIRAIDIRIAATGEDMSQTLHRVEMLTLAQSNRSFLDRVTGRDVEFVKHFKDITAITAANQSKNCEEALRITATLPESVRNEKFCLLQEYQAALSSTRPEALVNVVERFRSAYPHDVAVDLLSIDYYVTKENVPEAIQCALRFNKNLEGDAAVIALIAGLQLQNSQVEAARKSIDEAIQLEPDRQDSLWSKVMITAAQKEFATTRDTLKLLATDFGIDIDMSAYEQVEQMKPFLASPEGEELLKFLDSQANGNPESVIPGQ